MRYSYWLWITTSNALNLNNSDKGPKKQPRIYKANKKFPSKDLYIMTPTEASFTSKFWLAQCLESKSRGDEHIIKSINDIESYFLRMQQEEEQNKQSLYLAWMPEGKFKYGVKNILYIAVSEIICNSSALWGHLLAIKQSTRASIINKNRPDTEDIRNNEFDETFLELSEENIEIDIPPKNSDCYLQINMLIQAPTWNPSQIPSEDLKISLEDLAQRAFDKELDLSVLYEKNKRYKLAWKEWAKN